MESLDVSTSKSTMDNNDLSLAELRTIEEITEHLDTADNSEYDERYSSDVEFTSEEEELSEYCDILIRELQIKRLHEIQDNRPGVKLVLTPLKPDMIQKSDSQSEPKDEEKDDGGFLKKRWRVKKNGSSLRSFVVPRFSNDVGGISRIVEENELTMSEVCEYRSE